MLLTGASGTCAKHRGPSLCFLTLPFTIRGLKVGVYAMPRIYTYSEADYLKTALSIVIVSVRNLAAIIPALAPYMLLLIFFAAFAFWNGGVVLGKTSSSSYLSFISFYQAINRTTL